MASSITISGCRGRNWPRHEAKAFLEQYQAKAPAAGVDPLGYYLPPFAYGYMQVLQQAVEGTKGLDQDKLADYLRSTPSRRWSAM